METHTEIHKRNTLEVSEVFGPTIQGEGPMLGRSAVFIRVRRCPFYCQWCDTKYTWDKNDPAYQVYDVYTIENLADKVLGILGKDNLLILTGGEPVVWQYQLARLIEILLNKLGSNLSIEVETAGGIYPKYLTEFIEVRFNVSPKLSNSGMPYETRIKPEVLRAYSLLAQATSRAIFKFVVPIESWQASFMEIKELEQEYQLAPIFIMPEGTTPERILEGLRVLVNPTIESGWRLTPRLHTLLWGNTRGK